MLKIEEVLRGTDGADQSICQQYEKETFADIVNRLMPKDATLKDLERASGMDYAYLHALVSDKRANKQKAPAKWESGRKIIDGLAKIGAPVTQYDRDAMDNAIIKQPPENISVQRDSLWMGRLSPDAQRVMLAYIAASPQVKKTFQSVADLTAQKVPTKRSSDK